MTVAVSRAAGAGAEAVICASTGNTAASAAAYAARAGLRGAVIVPEGKIAIGKLAQALMHGARVIALRGNFDQALEIVRELAETPPGRACQLGQPLSDRGPEDRRVRGRRGAGRGARRACDPGRQRRQRHRLVARLQRARRRRPDPLRLSGRGRGAAGPRGAGGRARDGRLGDPDRQPGALGGGDGGLHLLARPGRGGHRRADPRRLPPARLTRGGFCEPASAASVAGLRAHGLPGRPRARPAGDGRLRAHRPRAQGPRHRARQGAVGDRAATPTWTGRARRVRRLICDDRPPDAPGPHRKSRDRGWTSRSRRDLPSPSSC